MKGVKAHKRNINLICAVRKGLQQAIASRPRSTSNRPFTPSGPPRSRFRIKDAMHDEVAFAPSPPVRAAACCAGWRLRRSQPRRRAALASGGPAAAGALPRPCAPGARCRRFSDAGLDGSTSRFSAFRGKVVVMNFWATWCPACRSELPTLDRLQQAMGRSGLQVISVSVDRGDRRIVARMSATVSSGTGDVRRPGRDVLPIRREAPTARPRSLATARPRT